MNAHAPTTARPAHSRPPGSSPEYVQRALTHALELASAYRLEANEHGNLSTTGEETGHLRRG